MGESFLTQRAGGNRREHYGMTEREKHLSCVYSGHLKEVRF